ncbi:putative F-box/LRR-repeat protein [Glycine max]|nr:putative F-box/LRR-repeat protein [Glycine max]
MENNTDKLSSLPELLCLFIISLLPFKDAVRTSILSKHWLHIWKYSPKIEFSENFDGNCIDRFEPFSSIKARRSAFMKFIKLWLDFRKVGEVEKFSLKFSKPNNDHREIIEECVTFVTQHGVKELELDFSDPFWEEEVIPNKRKALFELPKLAYGNKPNIESLKLSSCSFRENYLSNWQALKEVTFGWMEVTLDAMTIVLSNCKMIESLVLHKCWNLSHFEIGSEALSLKRLVVDKCSFRNALFKVSAPNLCFFKYFGKLCFFEMKNTLAIEEAHLHFYLGYDNVGTGARVMYDLVKDLYNARVLTVSPYLIQVILTGEKRRMEHDMNARHLILRMNMLRCELRAVSFFLLSCPMLECLTFELGSEIILPDYQAMWIDSDEEQDDLPLWIDSDEDQDDQAKWMDNDYDDDDEDNIYDDYCRDFINMVDNQIKGMKNLINYNCLESSLKLVEVKDFVGSKNGLVFLCYLIRYGKVLKNVSINVLKTELEGNSNVAFYRTIEEYLMTTPRASSNLQISICY